jgi:hypothetical protein
VLSVDRLWEDTYRIRKNNAYECLTRKSRQKKNFSVCCVTILKLSACCTKYVFVWTLEIKGVSNLLYITCWAEAVLGVTEDETATEALMEDVFETIEFNQTGDFLKGHSIKVVNLSFSLIISCFLSRCLIVISIILKLIILFLLNVQYIYFFWLLFKGRENISTIFNRIFVATVGTEKWKPFIRKFLLT